MVRPISCNTWGFVDSNLYLIYRDSAACSIGFRCIGPHKVSIYCCGYHTLQRGLSRGHGETRAEGMQQSAAVALS